MLFSLIIPVYNRPDEVDELLEVCAMPHGLFSGLPEIRRAPAILADYLELHKETDPEPQILPVVDEYLKYILSIKDDPKKLMAHIYVRHMGDLSGGQMIAKRVPGSGKMYQFGDNPEKIKDAIKKARIEAAILVVTIQKSKASRFPGRLSLFMAVNSADWL